MLENNCLNYSDIFTILKKVILDREFGEIITFENILKENPAFSSANTSLVYSEELEIIELCSIYIFCVMLNREEENIFPFLREYVASSLNKALLNSDEIVIKEQLEDFYSLEKNSIEQRYLFYMATKGFQAFNSDLTLDTIDFSEFDHKNIRKLLQKIFLTYYTQFNTYTVQGLFLLYKYGNNQDIKFDAHTQLLFDIMLKRIGDTLVCFDKTKEKNEEINFSQEFDKINLV